MSGDSTTSEIKVPEKSPGYIAANTLTVARAGLAFGMVLGCAAGNWEMVKNCLIAGVATDILDGAIAKLTGSTSSEGGLRDSLADLAFLIAGGTTVLNEICKQSQFVVPFAISWIAGCAILIGAKQWNRYAPRLVDREDL